MTGPTGPGVINSVATASVSGNNVYLNRPADEYIINISPLILGSALNSSASPPSWNLVNILAGSQPSSGVVPTDIFSIYQKPVKLVIQNVSGVSITVSLVNSPGNLTFFVFGEATNTNTVSYTIPGLSYLIIDSVFTNNLFIRFTNIYLDGNLDYVQVIDTMSSAANAGYEPANDAGMTSAEETLLGYILENSDTTVATSYDSSTLNGALTINVANQETNTGLVLMRIDTSNFNLTLDGSGIPSGSLGQSSGVMIMAIDVSSSGSGNLYTVALTNQSSGNFSNNPVTLVAGESYFIAVVGSNVYILDPSGFFGAIASGFSFLFNNTTKIVSTLKTAYDNLPPPIKTAAKNAVGTGVTLGTQALGSLISKRAPALGSFISGLTKSA